MGRWDRELLEKGREKAEKESCIGKGLAKVEIGEIGGKSTYVITVLGESSAALR